MRFLILALAMALVQPTRLVAEDVARSDVDAAVSNDVQIERIDEWIDDLESDRYLVREHATSQLRSAGEAAFDALLAAANGGQLEAADRSVGLLHDFGQSDDRELAIAALRRMTRLERHPAERWQAEMDLAMVSEQLCREKLTALGAEVSLTASMLAQDEQPQRFVSVEVRLTDAWNGTPGDLHAISRLEHCYRLKMEGTAVTDEVIEPLGALPALLEMRLFDSSVTPTVVNQLKTQHPDVTFYVVNTAKLGIGGEMVEGGIRITIVESDSGAEQADLKVDDIISEFNGQPLKHFDGLTARIAQHHPGDTVDLAIIRSDQQLTKTVTLGKWDPAQRR